MREKLSGFMTGALAIGVGIIVLGNSFGWWDIHLFFDGWWTLLLIIPCLLNMLKEGIHTGNLIGLGIGVLLLLAAQQVLPEGWLLKILLPTVLILVGASVLWGTLVGFKRSVRISKKGRYTYRAVFGGSNQKYPPEPFHGARITAVFGMA